MEYSMTTIPQQLISFVSNLSQELQDRIFDSLNKAELTNRLVTMLVDPHECDLPTTFKLVKESISFSHPAVSVSYYECGSKATIMHVSIYNTVPMIMVFGDNSFNVTDFLRELALL